MSHLRDMLCKPIREVLAEQNFEAQLERCAENIRKVHERERTAYDRHIQEDRTDVNDPDDGGSDE